MRSNTNKWRSIVAPVAIGGIMAMSAVLAFGAQSANAAGGGQQLP